MLALCMLRGYKIVCITCTPAADPFIVNDPPDDKNKFLFIKIIRLRRQTIKCHAQMLRIFQEWVPHIFGTAVFSA